MTERDCALVLLRKFQAHDFEVVNKKEKKKSLLNHYSVILSIVNQYSPMPSYLLSRPYSCLTSNTMINLFCSPQKIYVL